MPRKNIEDVYESLYDLMDSLNKIEDEANELVQQVGLFGGELKRVCQEQMNSYFIPSITKLRDDVNTPGCIQGVINFLDQIPLKATRIDPSASDYAEPENTNVEIDPSTLPASSSVDQTSEIPMNASYNNPQGTQAQTPVQESVLNEKHTTYCIKRKGIENSALGDDVGKITPHIVSEYRTRAEADLACNKLNKGVLPSEKEILGTEYFVDEIEFGDNNLIEHD